MLFVLFLFGGVGCLAGEPQLDFALLQGYRHDRQDFTISGPAGSPDVLSELIFKDIDIYTTRLQGRVRKGRYFLEALGAYGHIFSGKVVDNDYCNSGRKGHYCHSKHHITGEYTADYAARLGIDCRALFFTVGYAGYYQKMRFKGGHGETDYSDLNSTFRTKWYGPEWGVGAKKAIHKRVEASIFYRLIYPLCYHAKGHWNLREKGARGFSLTNSSRKSFGNTAGVAFEWNFFSHWKLGLQYQFMKCYAKSGHMQITEGRVPLKRAHLTSNEVRLAISTIL